MDSGCLVPRLEARNRVAVTAVVQFMLSGRIVRLIPVMRQ